MRSRDPGLCKSIGSSSGSKEAVEWREMMMGELFSGRVVWAGLVMGRLEDLINNSRVII